MTEEDTSVAVVHEHYYERGGAERVVEEIARTFDAPIYTGFVMERALPADTDGLTIYELFGDSVVTPLIKRSTLARDLYYQFAWQRVPPLTEYDVVILSGNNPGWYVPPEEQVVVRYVHTPPRTPYDQFHRRATNPVTKLYAYASRVLYYPNVPYPDRYVANSDLVARRLRRYLGVSDPAVVYPPVPVSSYEPGEREEFYLAYSRLVRDKRFDEMIRAFERHPDRRLVIGGAGPDRERLAALADGVDNVELRGYLSGDEKRDLLGRAKALVYAAVNEDFGMVPVEAFASGTPVIGVRDGFTKYQITDGETGVLFDRGVSELAAAVERFEREGVSADADDLVELAAQFGEDRFREQLRGVVADAAADAAIDVSFDVPGTSSTDP